MDTELSTDSGENDLACRFRSSLSYLIWRGSNRQVFVCSLFGENSDGRVRRTLRCVRHCAQSHRKSINSPIRTLEMPAGARTSQAIAFRGLCADVFRRASPALGAA